MIALKRLAWMDRSACRGTDPEAFFPEAGHPPNLVKRICATCPVQPECLQYSIEEDMEGMWGGIGNTQRAELRRKAGLETEKQRAARERKDDALVLRRRGMNNTQIAAAMGVSSNTIGRWIGKPSDLVHA